MLASRGVKYEAPIRQGEQGVRNVVTRRRSERKKTARRRGSCFPADRTLVSRSKKYEAPIRKGEQGVHDVGTRRGLLSDLNLFFFSCFSVSFVGDS